METIIITVYLFIGFLIAFSDDVGAWGDFNYVSLRKDSTDWGAFWFFVFLWMPVLCLGLVFMVFLIIKDKFFDI